MHCPLLCNVAAKKWWHEPEYSITYSDLWSRSNYKQFITTFLCLMLALLVEYIFLTTFYGLYFNHQFTHYNYTFFKFLHVPGDLLWAAFYIALFKFEFNQLLISIEKFSPLPGFEPGMSPPKVYLVGRLHVGNVTKLE